MKIETPRTDTLIAEHLHKHATDWNVADVMAFLKHSRLLERENVVLCDFINRELKMTGNDTRICELEKSIAALSNSATRLGGK